MQYSDTPQPADGSRKSHRKLFLVISGAILAACLCLGTGSAGLVAWRNTLSRSNLLPTPGPSTSLPIASGLPPAPITCSDDTCLEACLARVRDALGRRSFQPLEQDYAGTGASFNLVSYAVADGQPGEPQLRYVPEEFKKYQQDFQAQQRVWTYAASLLPPDQLKWITEYMVFTDGPYENSAWVRHPDLDRQHWTLAIDLMDSEDPLVLTYTLVHEFGHLVTLNPDQVPESDFYYTWYQNPGFCPQFLDNNGCSRPDSYMNLFYQKFWKDVYEEWMKTVALAHVDSQEEFRARVKLFYSRHKKMFSREYAATNIHEDMAVSFATFILEPRPEGKNGIEQKALFYYDFPELVRMRRQMIQSMCSFQ